MRFYRYLIAFLVVPAFTTAQEHKVLNSYNGQNEISASGSITLTPGFHVSTGSSFRAFIASWQPYCSPLAASPTQDQNYVITYQPRNAYNDLSTLAGKTVCEVNQTVQYFDGLGRALQTVQIKASPLGKDIVQPIVYDQYGREAKKFLPYASISNNGSYKTAGLTEVVAYYQTPQLGLSTTFGSPYSITLFDNSPLNEVLEQGAPGDAWQPASSGSSGSGHTVRTEQSTNSLDDNVLSWSFAPNGSVIGIGSSYSPGELFKTVTKDENWVSGKAGTVEEFKDKQGKLVLKRIWETETASVNTYYGYDDLGNLRYVLPPAITNGGSHFKPYFYFVDTEPNFHFVYTYNYDHRHRMTEKKIPGKGWEYVVYNRLNQIVATQDAEQRKNSQWLIRKYDGLGRVIMTGITTAASRAAIESALENQTQQWESYTGTGTGYSENCWPGSLTTVLTINYYDSYTFPGNAYGSPVASQTSNVTGLATGSKINVLATNTMLLTVNYYDEHGRMVQSKADNHIGGSDIVSNTYSFTGELMSSTRQHTSSSASTAIATRYTYDHVGRKKETFQQIDNQGEIKLVSLDYTETGQLLSKSLHDDRQITSYAYNERGWLKNNTSSQFSFQLNYQDGSSPQWNGNISSQAWGTSAPNLNTFTYTYDKLNRLSSGVANGMSEVLSYDVMGNVKTLNRDGTGVNTYNYEGNRLQSVTNLTGTYSYDANGNAIKDGRNGMDLFYNHLNLPATASKAGTTVSYAYMADGKKISKVATIGSNTTSRHYIDGIEYNGSVIDLIHTETGIAQNNGGRYTYHHNLTDHLGNVRYTFDIYNGAVRRLQADNYYAFGKRKSVSPVSGNNRYLYNGKELQEELGSADEDGQYDYGARFYDPVIGRFTTVDPKSGKYFPISPYAYVANNPINAIDPDGRDIIVLSAPKGASGAGHAAVLIGNAKDGWRLYSNNGTTQNGGIFGASNDHPENGVYYKSVSAFANSQSNFDLETGEVTYTSAFQIGADSKTDALMRVAASEVVTEDYNVLTNSCIDVVSDALEAGGFDGGTNAVGLKPNPPNMRYSLIKKNNQGKDATGSIKPLDKTKKQMRDNSTAGIKAREEAERREAEANQPSDQEVFGGY